MKSVYIYLSAVWIDVLYVVSGACPGMGSCFPYKEVHKKEVKAHGWPEGVNVRDPSSMGKKDLLALLNATITLEKWYVMHCLPFSVWYIPENVLEYNALKSGTVFVCQKV